MTDPAQTRQSLLIELGRRSDDAWTEFVGIYETAILAACRSRGLQDADARDATQEVLAAVHRKIVEGGGFDPEKGRFRAWLARVARNVSVDVLTARARRAASDEFIDQLPDGASEDEEAFDLEVRRALFDRAALRVRSEVKPTTWRAFEMTAVEGRAPAEVAGALGLTVGNVHVAKCRVLARIAERVDAFQIED